ncbi:hypothetical protein CGCFRS4_v008561 [Colletotrichum fructicola]|nr:hypothetical protein CGCFRS4_v008561 [Colletotrichum fructicola]
MAWAVYWVRNLLRRSLTVASPARLAARMHVSLGQMNIPLTEYCYTDPIPEEEDLAELVHVRLCAGLLHGQLVHAQRALKAATDHKYKD